MIYVLQFRENFDHHMDFVWWIERYGELGQKHEKPIPENKFFKDICADI